VLANRKRAPSFRGEGFFNRAFGVVRCSGLAARELVLISPSRNRPVHTHVLRSKELVRDYYAINPSLFQTSVTFQTLGLRKAHPMMHMSLNCSLPVTQIGKLVAVRIGRAAGQGNAVKVVKPLARRDSANDLLGRDTPISRIEFRLQELKSSEPPRTYQALSWDY
jgi:hypothetical protein